MSDEPSGGKSSSPHPEAVGERWGDPIGEERQAELRGLYARQRAWLAEPVQTRGDSVFSGIVLNSADVFWLAVYALAGPDGNLAEAEGALRGERQSSVIGDVVSLSPDLSVLHLEGACLLLTKPAGVFLWGAHLEGAVVSGADSPPMPFEQVDFVAAHLEGAKFAVGAHLEHAHLSAARLEGAMLVQAHLERAVVWGAHLERANLEGAYLEGTQAGFAHLEGANLAGAHLEGTYLLHAHLQQADLRLASFNKATRLNEAILTGASFDRAMVEDANLAVVDWSLVTCLGDEVTAQEPNYGAGIPKPPSTRLDEYRAAVRANRILARALRAQGVDGADDFAYRAQVIQREVLWRQKQWGPWLVSQFLWLVSGFGYRLWRIVAAYGGVLAAFTIVYWVLGIHSFGGESGLQALWDSFLVSLSAIHGRTTFEQLGAWTPAAWTAAVESVVGIVIEGVFVAMLVQRFFGR